MKIYVALGAVVLCLAMAASSPAPEVPENPSSQTGSRLPRVRNEPEVSKKPSASTGSRSPRVRNEPEVAKSPSSETGSRSPRAANEPEMTVATSPRTGSASPSSATKPEVAILTSSQTGSDAGRGAGIPEVIETATSIGLETAEDRKQAERTKKSATTTFCVEIRPGPNADPVKVCDDKTSVVVNDDNKKPTPSLPVHFHEPEETVYVVPSYAQPEVVLTNDPCPPQTIPYELPPFNFPYGLHQRPQTVLPHVHYPHQPCPLNCACAQSPNAAIALYRSAMAGIDGAHARDDLTGARSNDPAISGLEAETIDAVMAARDAAPETAESPTVGTFLNRDYANPLHHRGLYGLRRPHLIRLRPHLLPIRVLRTNDGASGIEENEQRIMAPAMEMPQQARYLVHPYANPVSGYQSHPVYHSYPSQAVPYSAHHSVHPGYAMRPQQTIVAPGSFNRYRSDEQRPLQINPEQQQEKHQEKSRSEDRHSADQTNRSDQSGPISPSQMLNRMRGSEGSSTFDLRPAMQTFPRINEDRIGNGLSVNMNFPRGGQPFMLPASRMTGIEEKKLKSSDCGHDEKSAGDNDN